MRQWCFGNEGHTAASLWVQRAGKCFTFSYLLLEILQVYNCEQCIFRTLLCELTPMKDSLSRTATISSLPWTKWLMHPRSGDRLFFHFSGHGGRNNITQHDLKDETGFNECIFPADMNPIFGKIQHSCRHKSFVRKLNSDAFAFRSRRQKLGKQAE